MYIAKLLSNEMKLHKLGNMVQSSVYVLVQGNRYQPLMECR